MNSCGDAGWDDPQPARPYDRDSANLGPYGTAWRTCAWCGSIHPDDLLAAIQAQGLGRNPTDEDFSRAARGEGPLYEPGKVTLGEADWKYGWPHKLYIHGIPNPHAGQTVQIGSHYHDGINEPTMGAAPATAFVKFYTKHLADAADFDALAEAITAGVPNVSWSRDEQGIKWRGHPGSGVR